VSRQARPRAGARRLRINWELIEQRRIASRLTRPQLAERVGASALTGPRRLWRDTDHDGIPLGVLERICEVLDLHPVELFTPPPRPARRPAREDPHVADAPPDHAVIEAALATLVHATPTTGQVSRAQLAAALGWSLVRLNTALTGLHTHLAGAGTRVEVDPDQLDGAIHGLQARHGLLTTTQREALHQLRGIAPALAEPAARALYNIAVHGAGYSEHPSHLDPHVAIALQQHGHARRRPGTSPYLEPTAAVRDALLLDE
jgi:DNA-binding Xre family transcriptional regulator